jgi:glycosyltransferase involved in cell wall biosynthesis
MEIIEPNISGLLVPQSDPIALAEAIRLLIDNPQLGEEFAKNGQNFVHQRFQLDTMVITHDNLYQNYFYRSHLQQPKIFAN